MHLFTLAGIPVRATLGFLFLVGFYAYSLRAGGLPAIGGWLIAIVVSVLVHEFGHALVARRFKLSPQVFLQGWGGLCAHDRAKSDRDDALIIVAGPLAGLALAGIVAIVRAVVPESALATTVAIDDSGVWMRKSFLGFLIDSMWFINFWWSLVNLLPLFPLDGGQLFRLGLLKVIKPAHKAERIVHMVAVGIAGVGVVWAISDRSILLAFISIALLMQNIRYLGSGSPIAVRTRNELVDHLLAEAQRTLAAGDAHEARRLAYQARDERNLALDQVQRAFELLAVTSVALEDWEEALDWAKRADATPTVDEARITALVGLGRIAEARHALAESKLSGEARARVDARLGS